MATSTIWKAAQLPWLTTFAPIFMGHLPECAFMAVTICSVRLKRHRRQLGLSHSLFLTTHLKPTWLVDVSTGSAWRAAGR